MGEKFAGAFRHATPYLRNEELIAIERTLGMPEPRKARAVGFNHVAIEVGDIDEALEFYGRLLDFTLRGRSETMAFIDMGDQFLALQKAVPTDPESGRHFGLVVDDKAAVEAAVEAAGIERPESRFFDIRDPWGNMVEFVEYSNIQFSKTPGVLRGMGLSGLSKNEKALGELAEKGMGEE